MTKILDNSLVVPRMRKAKSTDFCLYCGEQLHWSLTERVLRPTAEQRGIDSGMFGYAHSECLLDRLGVAE
jgi:hypothetical protein